MKQKEINSLLDLVEASIKVHKTNVPKGFIFTVKVPKEVREKIYKQLLDDDQVPEYQTLSPTGGYYKLKILGMKIHLY